MKVSQILALLSALMLSAITAHASEFKVSGRVAAKSGVPEMYATVRVFNEQDTIKPVAYCATDTAGVFSLTLQDAGKYNLSVAATGREPLSRTFEVSTGNPSAALGTITLGEETVNLD